MLLNKHNVKEYDLDINLRAMSLLEQLSVEENSKLNKDLFISQILMNCCMDENGDQLFDSIKDVESLPADLTLAIFKACLSLNNLGEKDVEKLAKN
jgi:hypothetical protein